MRKEKIVSTVLCDVKYLKVKITIERKNYLFLSELDRCDL